MRRLISNQHDLYSRIVNLQDRLRYLASQTVGPVPPPDAPNPFPPATPVAPTTERPMLMQLDELQSCTDFEFRELERYVTWIEQQFGVDHSNSPKTATGPLR
jgi:hypothetical protein